MSHWDYEGYWNTVLGSTRSPADVIREGEAMYVKMNRKISGIPSCEIGGIPSVLDNGQPQVIMAIKDIDQGVSMVAVSVRMSVVEARALATLLNNLADQAQKQAEGR